MAVGMRKKTGALREFETKAEKNVISAFTNLRKRENPHRNKRLETEFQMEVWFSFQAKSRQER